MSTVAILGAGDLGGAIAHAIATRGRIGAVTLVDETPGVAAGKALDIRQSGPIDRVDVRIDASTDLLAASGASVIVFADATGAGEWKDDRGLGLVAKFVRAGSQAAFVFAGANPASMMTLAARELGVASDRMIGTAASAVPGTVRALVGLETDGSGTDVSVVVTGRPPASVVAWSSATIGASLVADRVPAHRLAAISESLKKLWPPSPRAVAAPSARIVEALVFGSRQLHQALSLLDGELGPRGAAGLLPLSLGRGRILARVLPSLSPQERTEATTAISRA
jgi:malate dehydrogenase